MISKTTKNGLLSVMLALGFLMGNTWFLQAQQNRTKTITGTVLDQGGQALPGVTIVEEGTVNGTITNIDGTYAITISAESRNLQFSSIGYSLEIKTIPQSGVLNVQMKEDVHQLEDVVVVGYGIQRKSDLTGSISTLSTKDFNEGMISSPEQLISGKVSGVQIMQNSGSPTGGSTIRIRGGASLNASNDPLIVLDGVPLESGGISGNSGNFLSLINPNDIESMTILKDAASTAIYGSRASNGVILIETKKGSTSKGVKINFSSTNSIQTLTRTPDMLSHSEFINAIYANGTDAQKALIGTAHTDWNKQIYQAAFGTDNNISLSTRIADNMPLRASVGYYNQAGILKTDNVERLSGNLSVSPTFFDEHLTININAKGAVNNNTFAQSDAIWAASTFNPTIPTYADNNSYGGYNEALDANGSPVNGGVRNPLGLIEQYHSTSKVKRMIGNVDLDYKFHFLPELKFHSTVGYDYAKGEGHIAVPAEAAQYYSSSGRDYDYGPQRNSNKLLTSYFNYNNYFKNIKSSLEAILGYDYQFWKSTTPQYQELNTLGETQISYAPADQRHAMVSYYGRLNYSYDSRYMLTASWRRDGTSRFSEDNRWGTFPSVALAWRIDKEAFLEENPTLSTLKLRLSYGITGQQEGIGNYNYLPVYTYSQDGAQVQFGNQWYYSYRPEAYVSDLQWETTKSWNIGFDFGFIDDRITGALDYYTRKTEDLLSTVPVAAGTNFDKNILTNVGNVDSRGIELTLNASPIKTEDWNWDLSFNASLQKMNVKNLSLIEGGASTNTLVGPSIDGKQVQVLSEGYEPYMFYVYHQLYDEKTGKPIEGAYADLDDNGEINSSDLYRYKSPAPNFIFGFTSSLNYKNWALSMNLRANIDNYVYNGMAMNAGAWSTVDYNGFQLNNLSASFGETGFSTRQHLSDYYIENASFLKLDMLTLTYDFGKIRNICHLNVNAMVQNVCTITNYSGVDPEVPGGMDLSFYPRPRIYSIGLGLNF